MALDSGGPRGFARIALAMTVAAALLAATAPSAAASNSCFTPPCHPNYYGGPVVSPVRTVMVYWGSNTNAAYHAIDESLLADLATDSGTTGNVFSTLPEYSTVGLTPTGGHASSNQTLAYAQSYGGAYTITPSRCSGTTSCSLTLAQIQAEMASQIGAGSLPAPTGDGLETVYLLLFEQHVAINVNGSVSGVNFCAVHADASLASGTHVVFVILPDDAASGGCGTSPTPVNNETSYMSHELYEAITDPLIEDSGNVLGYPIAWLDPNNGEIGDMCNSQQSINTINGHSYTVQQEWSAKANNCVGASTYGHPSADFSSNPNQPVTFNGSGSSPNGDHSIASFAWDFGDGATGTGATTTHSYSAGGTYHVVMTATDSLGFVTHAAHDVTVESPPPPPPAPTPAPTSAAAPVTATTPPASSAAGPPTAITSFGAPATTLSGQTVTVAPGNTVSCNATVPCTATVVATATVPASLLASVKATVTVGNGRLTLQPGTNQKVTFKLTKLGAKLLRKLKTLKIQLTIRLTYTGAAAPVTLRRSLTIRQPAPRRA